MGKFSITGFHWNNIKCLQNFKFWRAILIRVEMWTIGILILRSHIHISFKENLLIKSVTHCGRPWREETF